MTPRLKSLSIENFRSIHGAVVVPLDAQVVLVHGTNGMGKTSVLSALQLGLTGAIAHLEDQSKYHEFLTNIGTASGSIHLVMDSRGTEASPREGRVNFGHDSFSAAPALDDTQIRFFTERCYLPQAVLGRLLEFYDQKMTTNSRLTHFVNELLHLDPLDALVDGLDHAFNVTRIRKIAPAYKELEAALERLEQQVMRERSGVSIAQEAVNARLARLNELIKQLDQSNTELIFDFDVEALRKHIAQRQTDESNLLQVTQQRSEVRSLMGRLANLEQGNAEADLAAKERREVAVASEYDA